MALPPEPPPELKARFLERLRGRLARLRDLAADRSAPAIEEMRQLAHALIGSSGTFGFPAVGDAARRLEQLLVAADDPQGVAKAVQELLEEGRRAGAPAA